MIFSAAWICVDDDNGECRRKDFIVSDNPKGNREHPNA
jgi:hypothetical protein